jgi:hypothetical protein
VIAINDCSELYQFFLKLTQLCTLLCRGRPHGVWLEQNNCKIGHSKQNQ